MSENISATPNIPQTNKDSILRAAGGVKAATPDIILFDEAALPVDAMSHLIFENIGGHEIINMLRYDTVDGKRVETRRRVKFGNPVICEQSCRSKTNGPRSRSHSSSLLGRITVLRRRKGRHGKRQGRN